MLLVLGEIRTGSSSLATFIDGVNLGSVHMGSYNIVTLNPIVKACASLELSMIWTVRLVQTSLRLVLQHKCGNY